MRVVVFGGRAYKDKMAVFQSLDQFHADDPISLIIEGGADGADKWGREWGKSRGVYVVTLWALWDHFGNPAGPLRNQAMIDILVPEYGIAFPGDTGTADMKSRLDAAGIPVLDLRKVLV